MQTTAYCESAVCAFTPAGVPLRSNNFPIGSLCILDIKPRQMTGREKRLLEVIAEDVMEEINAAIV